MTTTDNLGLSVYSEASGSATNFLQWRLAVAGTTTSNMEIIDNFAGETSASILSLQANAFTNVNASYISSNYYEATVGSITSYVTNMLINLKLNASITGSTTININAFGTKTLKKVNVEGTLSDLSSGDLKLNRYYLFVYNGTYFVLIGSSIADQVSITGTALNFVSISGSNVLVDSTVPVLTGVTSGSYNRVDIDVYGRVTGGSQVTYQEVSTITGSSVMSNTTGSTVKHNASGVTSGSYATVIVDTFGHVTTGSFYGSSILNTVIKTDSYTLLARDCACLASGSAIITLPTAVGAIGKTYYIKNIGVGTLTLASTSGSIDNLASQSLYTMDCATVISDNANWWVI